MVGCVGAVLHQCCIEVAVFHPAGLLFKYLLSTNDQRAKLNRWQHSRAQKRYHLTGEGGLGDTAK
jgi:hypothetical protein